MSAALGWCMRSGRWLSPLLLAAAGVLVACGPGHPQVGTPEQAVQRHIAAAKAGDVAALRSGSCGVLAEAIGAHSDDEVRTEFVDMYDNGPDTLSSAADSDAEKRVVTGNYTNITDLQIAFTVEDHGGWKVCEIRRGNGPFGALPGPFAH